ncbi:hypothetical protein LguiA_036090 [Lonicera macranthoides]
MEEKEEIAKNHLARSELPDRSVQLGKPLKPDHSKQHRRTEGLVPMMPSSKNTRMGETHRKKRPFHLAFRSRKIPNNRAFPCFRAGVCLF